LFSWCSSLLIFKYRAISNRLTRGKLGLFFYLAHGPKFCRPSPAGSIHVQQMGGLGRKRMDNRRSLGPPRRFGTRERWGGEREVKKWWKTVRIYGGMFDVICRKLGVFFHTYLGLLLKSLEAALETLLQTAKIAL
jgi:hypothetical protein